MDGTPSKTEGQPQPSPPHLDDGPPVCACCTAVLIGVLIAAGSILVARRLFTKLSAGE